MLPVTCKDHFNDIIHRIHIGAPKHRADGAVRAFERELAEFRENCSDLEADYLLLLLHHTFTSIDRSEATLRAQDLLKRSAGNYAVRFGSLRVLAKLTLERERVTENNRYRRWALILARKHGNIGDELTVLANWAFALLSRGDTEHARRLLHQAQGRLASVPEAELETSSFREIRARLATHQAKALLREENKSEDARLFALEGATRLYREAVAIFAEFDHVRVNISTEAADEIGAHAGTNRLYIDIASEFLDLAHRGLDTHTCESCLSYFEDTRRRLTDIKQKTGFNLEKAVEVKPGILGVSFDLGYLVRYLAGRWRRK